MWSPQVEYANTVVIFNLHWPPLSSDRATGAAKRFSDRGTFITATAKTTQSLKKFEHGCFNVEARQTHSGLTFKGAARGKQTPINGLRATKCHQSNSRRSTSRWHCATFPIFFPRDFQQVKIANRLGSFFLSQCCSCIRSVLFAASPQNAVFRPNPHGVFRVLSSVRRPLELKGLCVEQPNERTIRETRLRNSIFSHSEFPRNVSTLRVVQQIVFSPPTSSISMKRP